MKEVFMIVSKRAHVHVCTCKATAEPEKHWLLETTDRFGNAGKREETTREIHRKSAQSLTRNNLDCLHFIGDFENLAYAV